MIVEAVNASLFAKLVYSAHIYEKDKAHTVMLVVIHSEQSALCLRSLGPVNSSVPLYLAVGYILAATGDDDLELPEDVLGLLLVLLLPRPCRRFRYGGAVA